MNKYSNNGHPIFQAESAGLMATMVSKEAKKGLGLPLSMKLPMLSSIFMPFYTSLPGVNHALAIQMASTFRSPRDVVTAAQATLMRKLKLDEKKAKKIHSYFRTAFQPDMTSCQ
jgi:ERCC4-type nuclease